MFDRDAMAKAAYEKWYEGYFMPAWEDAPFPIRHRAYEAVDAVLQRVVVDLSKPRARVVKVREGRAA